MLCEIFKPEQRRTGSREGHGNPTERVIEIPNCDPDASFDLNTGSHGLNRPQLELIKEIEG